MSVSHLPSGYQWSLSVEKTLQNYKINSRKENINMKKLKEAVSWYITWRVFHFFTCCRFVDKQWVEMKFRYEDSACKLILRFKRNNIVITENGITPILFKFQSILCESFLAKILSNVCWEDILIAKLLRNLQLHINFILTENLKVTMKFPYEETFLKYIYSR